MNLLGATLGQERFHISFMNGRAIPNHQQFIRHVQPQVVEKDCAVEAMKEGAADFITKPLRLDELQSVASKT